jgi:hypothetical protein
MTFPDTLNGWAMFGLLITVIALGFTLLRSANAKLKSSVGDGVYEELRSRAKTIVAALAQDPILAQLENAEKKQRAMLWLMNFASGAGIELSDGDANALVEEAVFLVKALGR